MKKILIIGSSGAGKSTFSKRLSKKLKINTIHLDHLFWLPDWKERPRDQFDKLLDKELAKDLWIIDGNYHRTLPVRLSHADTVIHLDFNRWLCLYRAIKRWFLKKEKQAPDCSHKFSLGFFWFILYQYPKAYKIESKHYKQQFPNIKWIDLKTPKQAEAFLQNSK